jgi:hypothetical protein
LKLWCARSRQRRTSRRTTTASPDHETRLRRS